MVKRSVAKGVVKDVIIVVVGVIIIWLSIQAVFGTQNPFYVVASGSMVPELSVYDVLIIQGRIPFDEVAVGDVIVFDRPSDHNRVIVHRVVSVIDDDPRTLRTKGDANSSSIPGTDFPITEKEYIGSVAYVIPQLGYVTQVLKPPVNYIIIVVVIGIMITKQLLKKPAAQDPKRQDAEDADTDFGLQGMDKVKKDTEYTRHTEKPDPQKDAEKASENGSKQDRKDEK